MSKFFINHPIPALVLSIILTLVGILTAIRLPVAEYPDIAPPTVFVSTSYIGADSSVVNNTVAQIIEEAVNGAGDIDFMSSTIDICDGLFSGQNQARRRRGQCRLFRRRILHAHLT